MERYFEIIGKVSEKGFTDLATSSLDDELEGRCRFHDSSDMDGEL